jgi:hypothetical protein
MALISHKIFVSHGLNVSCTILKVLKSLINLLISPRMFCSIQGPSNFRFVLKYVYASPAIRLLPFQRMLDCAPVAHTVQQVHGMLRCQRRSGISLSVADSIARSRACVGDVTWVLNISVRDAAYFTQSE